MVDISREQALASLRHTRTTLGALIAKAEKGDEIANAVLSHILDLPLQDLVNQGPPDPFPRGADEGEINAYRRKIAAYMIDRGAPVERTAAEILAHIAGADPQERANVRHVIGLMTSPPEKGRGGVIRGYGDLCKGSGDKRSQAYILRPETASRFGFTLTGDVVQRKVSQPKNSNSRGTILAI